MAIESKYGSAELVPGRWEIGKPLSTHTFTTGDAGFGVAMWTFPARKEALVNFAGPHRGNFALELAFVAHELSQPLQVIGGKKLLLIQHDTLHRLQHARSTEEATATVM